MREELPGRGVLLVDEGRGEELGQLGWAARWGWWRAVSDVLLQGKCPVENRHEHSLNGAQVCLHLIEALTRPVSPALNEDAQSSQSAAHDGDDNLDGENKRVWHQNPTGAPSRARRVSFTAW